MTLKKLFNYNERKPQDILNEYALSVLQRLFLKWPDVSPEELMEAHERSGVQPPDVLEIDKKKMMTDLLTFVILKAYPSTPLYMAEVAAKYGVSQWRQ